MPRWAGKGTDPEKNHRDHMSPLKKHPKAPGIVELFTVDPPEARRQLLKQLDKAKGNRTLAARRIGVDKRTMFRWLDKLNLWQDLDKLCSEKGYDIAKPARRGTGTVARRSPDATPTRKLSALLRLGDPAGVSTIREAFEANRGSATGTAKTLGITHRTLMRWLNTYPTLQSALDRIRHGPAALDSAGPNPDNSGLNHEHLDANIEIGAEIGSGMLASVYKGMDVQLNRPVAIKIVRASGLLVSTALDHA